MLRILAAAVLIITVAPTFAAEPTDATGVAQENKAVQQAPKRDCEKREEGVS
jgi:hypothetical protein